MRGLWYRVPTRLKLSSRASGPSAVSGGIQVSSTVVPRSVGVPKPSRSTKRMAPLSLRTLTLTGTRAFRASSSNTRRAAAASRESSLPLPCP